MELKEKRMKAFVGCCIVAALGLAVVAIAAETPTSAPASSTAVDQALAALKNVEKAYTAKDTDKASAELAKAQTAVGTLSATSQPAGCPTTEQLDNAKKALADLKAAIAGKDDKVFADAMAKATKAVTALKTTATSAPAVSDKIINKVCPMMGDPVDPDKVSDKLTRTYKGYKIGFCCSACPPQWDKLTDEQKDKKLQQMLKEKD
jgi:hypothetical protein